MRAALGFRAHTGWAVAVAVTTKWQVVARLRIDCEPAPTRFIYHRAAEIMPATAEALIATAHVQSLEKAQARISALISALPDIAVTGAGVPGGNARLPAALAEILAAHSCIHAAEGAFYRDVLAEGCARVGLQVSRVPERDLWAVAGKTLGCSKEALRDRLATLGKQIGPPWAEDQKCAALAALIALNSEIAAADT